MGLSMYLTGWMFQIIFPMNRKQPHYFDQFEWIHAYWGDVVATIILGTVLYLSFETPFMEIEGYIYEKLHKKASGKATKSSET
jgi:hypothetical protein